MAKNVLVVEGADCMGKSTLIKDLQKKLGWEVIHTGGPKVDDAALELSFRAVEQGPRPVIYDRVPMISEIAYRPINTEGKKVSWQERESYIRRFIQLDAALIVCRRKELPDIVTEERPHKPAAYWRKVKAGYPGIVDRYDKLADQLNCWDRPIYLYDWAADWEPKALDRFLNMYVGDN